MTSKSHLPYPKRAASHSSPLVATLFNVAERKRSNVVLSADLTSSKELLSFADKLGPYIAVFKTHCDIVSDFGLDTIQELKSLSEKHDFLIFEDRKLIDIGNTVQKQYHGGVLKLSEWAHLINASVLGGDGIIEALSQTGSSSEVKALGERGILLLAEMTSQGSLATGDYTKSCIRIARKFPEFAVGFVAMRSLTEVAKEMDSGPAPNEDFVIFTTGVNRSSKGDVLGQTYNTPRRAVLGGADFIIAGRGIYAAEDPIAAVKAYQSEGWQAYEERVKDFPS